MAELEQIAEREPARRLIHVGYPKTASTYLQRWFASHPQIAYAPWGIDGYGSVLDIVVRATEDAHRLLRVTSAEGLAAPRQRASGELDYGPVSRDAFKARQRRACEILRELLPSADVLIVTRGFRGMIVSSYSEYVATGGEGELASMLEGPLEDHPWRYDELISLYREAFGAERVLLLPYELLRDDPEAFFGHIERRASLAPHRPGMARINETLSPQAMALAPVFNRLARGAAPGLVRRGLASRKLAPLIGFMARLGGRRPVTADLVTDEVLDRFRGCCETLRGEPLYAPYAADYLL